MACCLFNAKQSPDSMLTFHTLEPKEQAWLTFSSKFLTKEKPFESVKSQPFCSGLNVLNSMDVTD